MYVLFPSLYNRHVKFVEGLIVLLWLSDPVKPYKGGSIYCSITWDMENDDSFMNRLEKCKTSLVYGTTPYNEFSKSPIILSHG